MNAKRVKPVVFLSAALVLLLGILTGCDLLMSDETRIERARELGFKGDAQAAIIELKKVLQNDANNKAARLLLGEMSLVTGQVAAAEKELRRAYDLGVPFDEVAVPLGHALLAQDAHDRVLDEIDPAIVERDEVRATVFMIRGYAFLGKRGLPDAERAFQKVLALEPDSIDGRIGLARSAQLLGDLDRAKEYIEDALSLEPFAAMAWLTKGQLEFQRKRYSQAEDAFVKAIENGKLQANALQEFIARNGLAEAQWRQGKSDAALENVERMMQLAPRHPRSKYFRALIAYGAGDYETAMEQLQEVLVNAPQYRPAQLLLGAAHYAKGNLEQADMYLSSLLAADPSSVGARKLLAATHLRQRKPGEAMATLQPAITRDGSDQTLFGLASLAAFQTGDADSGILYLEQGLRADPENQSLKMDLATGYLTSGDLDQAIEILEKLPETKEGAYRREVLLILAYLRKRDTKNALAQSQALLAKRPNDPGMYNLVGSIHMVAGELAEARRHFDKALQLAPENAAILMNLGRLDFKEGKYDLARKGFERVLEISSKNVNAMLALAQLSAIRDDQQQVAQWLQRASAVSPQNAAPRLLLAHHYLTRRNIEKAREVATKLANDARQNAEAQNTLGIVQMEEGDYRAAADSFRKATRLAPKSANFHYNLARAQLEQQNFGESEWHLRKTIELDPSHVLANSVLAIIEIRAGKTREAFARAQRLQKQNPENAVGYKLEGDLHMIKRDFTRAVHAYSLAIKYADSAIPAIRASQARRMAKMPHATEPLEAWLKENPDDLRTRFMLGRAFQAENRAKLAIEQYERILQEQPDHAIVLNNLAWLYYEQNDSRALEFAERAHQNSPQSGAITDTLGWLLVQEGHLERGLQLLREAARQAPGVPEVRYHLAVALARSGAKDEARKTLTELVNSGKSFKEMEAAKKLLQRL